MEALHVIKLGGSLLSPSLEKLFDYDYTVKLLDFLENKRGKFILIAGGGMLSRYYQRNELLSNLTDERKHWLGIAAINMNAEVLYSLTPDNKFKKIIRYSDFLETTPIDIKEKFLIAAASEPGYSSDYNAFTLAKRVGAKSVISLSNIDGVYTADPRKDSEAKLLENVSWKGYLDIIGNPKEHVPGANYPIDPVAARYAKENGLSLSAVYGENLNELEKVLDNREFTGTFIS